MIVQEIFNPVRLTASGAITQTGNLGGFFCTVAGNLTITAGYQAGGATIVGAFDVLPGIFYPLPFAVGAGAYAVLAGGAQGTFGVL